VENAEMMMTGLLYNWCLRVIIGTLGHTITHSWWNRLTIVGMMEHWLSHFPTF